MDNGLDRSVRLLEDALSTPKRGLFKMKVSKTRTKNLDLSISLAPNEMQRLLTETDASVCNDTMNLLFNFEDSMTGSIIQANEPWRNALDSLYVEFLEVLQTHSGGHDVLDVVSDLGRCCSDALNVIQALKSKVAKKHIEEESWLENERNTWRLIFILYQDRLHSQNLMEDDIIVPYTGLSEKLCIENLFKRDGLVRESQLVVDWLECNSADREDHIVNFSDVTTGWENTLHQLKSADTIAFGSSRKIVSNMDPDAPHYENLPLHDLDEQDERLLCYKVFRKIRAGKLLDAQELCNSCGHAWRAALLEGWKLYHNPELQDDEGIDVDDDESMENSDDSSGIEGNPSRGIWKKMALQYCKNEKLNVYERASIAAYCGSLDTLLSQCHSWEDTLWAYMRTMVDIRVESEIRDNVERNYKELPETYWEQRMSINEIFQQLEASRNTQVKNESSQREHIIQKYLILDNISSLVESLETWVEDSTTSSHFIRFAAHLVMFLEQIGQIQNRESVENIIEAYIKRLSQMNETQLVAYYVSKAGPQRHIILYASYLEQILDEEDRKAALKYAEESGLNVFAITKQVVENIRNKPQEVEQSGNLQHKLSKLDELKISALDWVLFYEEQRAEALIQSNAVIFSFLILGKVDAAQLAFNKIPKDTVDIMNLEKNKNSNISQSIKEHLSYKSYLAAQEAFNDWYEQFKSKPLPPQNLLDDAQFTEKVAYQHRLSQYKSELDRWQLACEHLAQLAKSALYNVLLFPGGWLVGTKDAEYLRSSCIPEVVLLLYTVLFESGFLEESIQLADVLATEKYGLYKVFSREKLGEVLVKLCESSLSLLNAKKDPWSSE